MTRLAGVLLLIAACGGGGGSPPPANGGTVPALRAEARAVLESCATATFQADLDALDAFARILRATPGAPVLRFQLVTGTSVSWLLDRDGDGTDDLTGSLRFLDAAGAAFTPFSLQLLVDGTPLVSFFAGLPADTRLALSYASAAGDNVTGTLAVSLAGGAASRVTGNHTTTTPDCSGTYRVDDVPLADLDGPFPIARVQVSIQSADGLVLGTLTLNGSAFAVAEVRRNGLGEAFTFFLDLVTGSVT